MKIKTKLTLGVGLLFILIVLLSAVGVIYINALKNDTENILVANYNTLEYSRNMILALDENSGKTPALEKFEENLKKQEKNITEIGEKEATEQLKEHFSQLRSHPDDRSVFPLIRKDISDIMLLNMQAIQRKSNVAKETASSAIIWIAVTGVLCFLIAFALLINLPKNIANPIKELTLSIQQIANKNYSQHLHFEGNSEFGELAKAFNSMAVKMQEYESVNYAKLLSEKKRIDTLINKMSDPIIGLDESRRILFVNDEALKILGLKREELIGKFAQDVSITNDLMRLLMKDLMIPENEFEKEKPAPLKIFADNKQSYFDKEIIDISVPKTDETDSALIGHVIILQNITPFKELDFAKSNFIGTVSHELKTPISSIKMSLQLLENKQTGNINEEQRQLIESIKDDSNRLLKITGELVNISQVETGNIQLNIQQSSPDKIRQIALDAVKIQAEQKRIELISEIGEDVPKVKADTEKTAWVLINFLTNAIRYSPEHSKIYIHIRRDGNSILFSVKDEGKGIDSRYRDKIFERYFQVPGSSKMGTGLGLAISKEFIEAQGGQIGVETEIGSGSTFYFRLPA